MARFSIPIKGRLSSDVRLPPSNLVVQKTLSRLSRPSLLFLVLEWLNDDNAQLCAPLLGEEDDGDGFYPPASSIEELRAIYADLQHRKGSKREVFDRITEGDWQHGLTLYQMALADAQYLQDHPTSQKWTAYRIAPLKEASYLDDEEQPPEVDKESLILPRFHPSSFIQSLQAHVLPDVKAHYHFHRPQGLALSILRIFLIESPYSTSMTHLSSSLPPTDSDFDSSRTLYVAFPDASPFVYLSKSQAVGSLGASESKSFRSLVVEGIPKALSRPRERYTLKPTNISTKNLDALLHVRGVGRTNAAGGGWGIYADKKKNESPLDSVLPTPPLSEESSDDALESATKPNSKRKADGPDDAKKFVKRARLCAQARFGDTAKIDDGLGIERVDIVIEDPFPNSFQSVPMGNERGPEDEADIGTSKRKGGRRSNAEISFENHSDTGENRPDAKIWVPNVKLTFHGPHVFAGIRQLVENGIIDGERMPGWLTGEEGVTVGAVRHGRIRGHKGSGL
ncbi:centromere protein Chl4/mis15/CENP-N [Colletotrichum navitas]|uniref:Centromere protein Chl4/mis15/CENP-N n=1 Tax=Colletotrichum navitas TaxID=681940 RepID=A0AAD8Q522_9PEZI|nr:centromere protein Chl4/mis15/CENP-N [Colletotrichum navitas]KAK1596003.1 centromere protein Chl4/mis15/CENP-N [Colletotrichum navitas]